MFVWILLVLLLMLLWYVLYIVSVFVVDEWKMRKEAPYVWSYLSHKRLLIQNKKKLNWKYILDMWCGDGGMLRFFTKKIWYEKWVGYDIRRFPIRLGRLMNMFYDCNNIVLYRGDFQKAHLEKYDTLYLFLWASVVVKLEKRIHDGIRPGTIVITNTFHFRNREPFDVIRNNKGKVVFKLYTK